MPKVLRDYQHKAADFLLIRNRGFVVAPAGAGKTVIGSTAVSRWVRSNPHRLKWRRVVWMGNTREQVQQAESALMEQEGPQDLEIEVGCAAGNLDTARCDLLVVDESHRAPAATWTATIDRAAQAGAAIWGLSATPWSEDPIRNQQLTDTFREFFTIERQWVLDGGFLVPGKVLVHDLDQDGQFDLEIEDRVKVELRRRCARFSSIPAWEHERRARWQITQEFVQANPVRNAAAVALARSDALAGHSVLVLVHSIEHGNLLADQIGPLAAVCHSKIGLRRRRELIDGFREGSQRVLVATSLADEGLDVPRASRLILVAGGRAAGKLEQRAGRILRPYEGKVQGIVHDFLDRGARFAHAQAKARFRVYEKLGYEPEIVGRPLRAAA